MAIWKAILLSGLLAPAFVNAGEVLRFSKGDIDLRHQQNLFKHEADRQIWIVQLKSTITAADQKALSSAGARVFRYIPDDALVVKGSRSALQKHLAGRVQGFLPYRGDFKLSENLPTFSVFSVGKRAIFSVTVIDNEEVASALTAMKELDSSLQVVQRSGRFLDVAMASEKVPALAQLSGIEYVETHPEIVPLHMPLAEESDVDFQGTGDYTDLTGYETGTKVMGFEAAWKAGYSGAGQTVSIADTGLDKGDVRSVSADFLGAITKGYVFGVGAKTWEDPMGHGTHVAGSVAGRGTASAGALRGGAFGAQLIPEGMWSPIMDNLTVPPKLANLFTPAYQDGARIHTNSWGAAANFGAYDSMAVQADDFLWNNQEMLILFAAGNSGVDKDKNGVIDPNSIGTPGTAKNVLTVGASENLLSVGGIQRQVKDLKPAKDSWPAEPIWSSKLSDDPKGIACFSSRGPTRDGRLKPEIVAPGTNILSAASQVTGADPLWGAYNKDYVYSGGTSMATPLAAGGAAVAREVLIKKYGMSKPSGALVKAFLMHTAFDLYPGQYGEGTPTQELSHRPNNDEGYGRVDMEKIVSLTAGTQFVDSAGVSAGEIAEITLNLAKGQNLLANLVYFDAPGTPSAAVALVNNLDLILVTPDGQQLGSRDSKNNHEILELSNLPGGTYKLLVKGTNVPMGKAGKQPYALVYTVQ